MKDTVDLFLSRITLGNLLSMITIIVSVSVSYANTKADIKVLQNDIEWIKSALVIQAPANQAAREISNPK